MDSQGIEAAVNYAAIATEYEFEGDLEALYANQRAENRYLGAEWGFNYKNRLFTPPVISTVDAASALAELDAVMSDPHGPPKVIQLVAGPSIHRSPFRPEPDRFWARLNEARINICTHLSTVTFYGRQGLEWDEDEVMLGDMDAFQWMMYYGDRPARRRLPPPSCRGCSRFPTSSSSSPNRERSGCPTSSARWTTRSCSVGAPRGGSWTSVRASTSAPRAGRSLPGGERRSGGRDGRCRTRRLRVGFPSRRGTTRSGVVPGPAQELHARQSGPSCATNLADFLDLSA